MDEPSRGYRFSSARRPSRWPSSVVIAVAAIGVLVVVLVVSRGEPEPETVAPTPTPTAAPQPTASPPPTATPVAVDMASEWITVTQPEDTPTPFPTIPVPERRPPTPTPRISECVDYRWTTVQVFRPIVQVVTEITASNNCNRDIQPTDLLFEVAGWRDGGLVQSVRAMPFDRIRRRRSGIITIGLPGSLDWYHEITVEIID
jgi:hypothetical protein